MIGFKVEVVEGWVGRCEDVGFECEFAGVADFSFISAGERGGECVGEGDDGKEKEEGAEERG